MVADEETWPIGDKEYAAEYRLSAWKVLGRVGLKWCNSADRCIADANERGKVLKKANTAHEAKRLNRFALWPGRSIVPTAAEERGA